MSPQHIGRSLLGVYQNFFDNPILTRELRRRMRGKALLYSIIGYIVIMTAASIMILLVRLNPFAIAQGTSQELLDKMSQTGQSLFRWIITIQSLLVLIIAPTITAGLTTGEKEKKTFDFLRVTTITPWMYITGSFLSTVFYVSLALLCALPLISLAYLYGGVGVFDVLRMALVLLGSSMILSAFGLLISSIRERTRTAQGIVVFVIFAAIFGGSILYSQVTTWLGTASAATAAGGGAANAAATTGVTLLGIPMSTEIVLGLGMLAITVVLLLVAARKLFEPDETRAFSHWQFAAVAAVTMGLFLAALSGTILSNTVALGFLSAGCVFLLTAAITFGSGRMEVGDEIWHLKRLLPFLRPIDQTIPYLAVIGGLWFYAIQLLKSVPASLGAIPSEMIDSTLLVSLGGFVFFCLFARWATALTVGRKGAGRITLAVVSGLWVGLPLLMYLLLSAGALEGGVFFEVCSFVGRFSPFFVMAEGIEREAHYAAMGSDMLGLPGFPPFAVYMALSVVFLIIGEAMRYRRWKGFDYHYDMPAA